MVPYWITIETGRDDCICLPLPTAITWNQYLATDFRLVKVFSRSVVVSVIHTLSGVIGSGVHLWMYALAPTTFLTRVVAWPATPASTVNFSTGPRPSPFTLIPLISNPLLNSM